MLLTQTSSRVLSDDSTPHLPGSPASGVLKSCCPGVIRLCNYWRNCCFPDKGCLRVWYYFYPEVFSSRKAMSSRHNRARKQTLPDTTRDLPAKYDIDLTGEQPHGLYSPPHHRHSTATETWQTSSHIPLPRRFHRAWIGHPSLSFSRTERRGRLPLRSLLWLSPLWELSLEWERGGRGAEEGGPQRKHWAEGMRTWRPSTASPFRLHSSIGLFNSLLYEISLRNCNEGAVQSKPVG